eukprot:UN14262
MLRLGEIFSWEMVIVIKIINVPVILYVDRITAMTFAIAMDGQLINQKDGIKLMIVAKNVPTHFPLRNEIFYQNKYL